MQITRSSVGDFSLLSPAQFVFGDYLFLINVSGLFRPLNEVSFGKLLFDLFQVAHRFQLTLQPQLLMLQKTLLNIEGLGRQLDPELDIWSVAKPELETILREKHNFESVSQEFRERLPGWLAEAPEIPGLVHDFLVKANSGQLLSRTVSEDAARSRREQQVSRRKILQALGGWQIFKALR